MGRANVPNSLQRRAQNPGDAEAMGAKLHAASIRGSTGDGAADPSHQLPEA